MSETVSASSIANALASGVHSGKLVAGDMLPSERDLCARFGVGRNVVREASMILQGMGLADHSKGNARASPPRPWGASYWPPTAVNP